MFYSFDPSFAGTYLGMASCATVGMAGIAGNSPLPVNSNEIALAWLQWIGIIMAIIARYKPVFINRFCGCRMTFLARDIIIHWVFFMRNNMTFQAKLAAVLMWFYSQCLGNKWFTGHVTCFTDILWHHQGKITG